MCNKAVEKNPWELEFVLDRLKTQEMCNKAVARSSYMLGGVADHFKTQEICEKAVEKDPYMLGHMPDWFLTQQQVGPWYDDDEFFDDDEIVKWCNGYQKRKPQKAQIKKVLKLIACHPSRCLSEDVKKQTEQLWV